MQQTTVAVTRVDILNDITSKILGGHYHGCPPFLHKYWGDMSPCPIGVDAPDHLAVRLHTDRVKMLVLMVVMVIIATCTAGSDERE